MAKRLIAAFLLLAVTFQAPLFIYAGKAKSKEAPVVDILSLLAPPPAQDSQETKAELQELKDIQKSRTKEQEASAQGDLDKDVFRFADVLGDKFKTEDLPLTTALFKKAVEAGANAVKPIKKFYDRPRPFIVDKDIHPCVKEEDTAESYPSGHATAGYVMAVLLANMVPEKKAEIFARGWLFAHNRLVGGVHYRSDVEGGRIAGTLVACQLLKDHKFKKEFDAAKAELRKVLGLSEAAP
jgi:acid phosphatase (class A)